jgi:hypothetical protein
LEEKDILYFSKNFFHIYPSRGKALSNIWCKELGVPLFLCGKIIVLPICVITESANKEKNIVKTNLCEWILIIL